MPFPYDELEEHVRELTGSDVGFDSMLMPQPQIASSNEWSHLSQQSIEIEAFFRVCSRLFFEDLEQGGWLSDLLLRDIHESFGRSFHLALPDTLRHTPRFYRTDQPSLAKVNEIQCPGSGWGEHVLLGNFYARTAGLETPFGDLAAMFAIEINSLVGNDAKIHHLIDNASSLVSNLYFANSVRRASPTVKYYGFDRGVRPQDCNFVRTHLFEGLVTENMARPRRRQAVAGRLLYDYPNVCIYEQKALLALPFLPETTGFFSDGIRSLLPYTALIRPSGIMLEDGEQIALSTFANLPRRNRHYFIKYGGADPSRNWGSRAVYYAGDSTNVRMERLLKSICQEYDEGRGVWILQQAITEKSPVEYIDGDGSLRSIPSYHKYSGFYGPSGLLGAMSMHRATKKVHGQSDSIRSIVIPA